MSNPYGPKIETVYDWNEVLGSCGCCSMPTPPEPNRISESIRAVFTANSVEFEDGVYYKTKTTNYWYFDPEGTYFEEQPFTITTRGWNLNDGPCNEVENEIYPEGSYPPEGSTVTASEVDSKGSPFTSEAFVSAILGRFEAFEFPLTTCAPGNLQIASLTGDLEKPSLIYPGLTKVRYRWQVPIIHLGDYFKITWDVLYEPVGWDDESIPEEDRPVRFSIKDLTEVWSGPGTGDQDDESWLAGDWYDLEIPEELGERRVINIRCTMFSDDPFEP